MPVLVSKTQKSVPCEKVSYNENNFCDFIGVDCFAVLTLGIQGTGNSAYFLSSDFFQNYLFKTLFQEYHQSAKKFGSTDQGLHYV